MTALFPPPLLPPPTSDLGSSPPARLPAQIATWLTCSAAMLIVAVAAGLEPWGAAAIVALGAGAAVSILTPIGARFRSLAGAMVALLTAVGLFLAFAIAAATMGAPGRLLVGVPFVALFVLGLDWRRVDRLRPLLFLSGFAVLLGVASGEPWTYAAGAIWLVLTLGSFHLLETDRRAALAHIRPLAATGPPPERPGDLLATIAAAVVIAVTLAVLLSAPSCRNPFHDRNRAPGVGEPQGSPGSGGSGSAGAGQSNGSGKGSGGAGGDGSAGGGGAAVHRYVPTAEGDFLVPNRSGRPSGSRIPGPNPRGGWTDGRAFERGADGSTRVYRRLPDGSTRIRVTDADGRVRSYDFRPQPDGMSRVIERDSEGQTQHTFTYDPDGRLTDGGSTTKRSPSNGEPSGKTPTPSPKKRPKLDLPSGRVVLMVLGALLLVAGIVWLVLWRLRKPAPPAGPPWAVALARTIEDEGRRRGRPRRTDETIVAYVDALADDVLPDTRLGHVGRVLDAALFTASGVDGATQQQAIADWELLLADHPRRHRHHDDGVEHLTVSPLP